MPEKGRLIATADWSRTDIHMGSVWRLEYRHP